MNCTIITADVFAADEPRRLFVARKRCKPGSIFQRRLFTAEPIDGVVALVEDFGEIVGWARTEPWAEPMGDGLEAGGLGPAALHWNTLEAFVAPDYRERGVAGFAVSGLRAAAFIDDPAVAVFHPVMMLLARKIGLMPTLFREQGEGWVRA